MCKAGRGLGFGSGRNDGKRGREWRTRGCGGHFHNKDDICPMRVVGAD